MDGPAYLINSEKNTVILLIRAVFKNLKPTKKSTQFLFQLGINCPYGWFAAFTYMDVKSPIKPTIIRLNAQSNSESNHPRFRNFSPSHLYTE